MTRFKNRLDAAQKLIPYLNRYHNDPGVVLAVPRGGVPIAYPIAKACNLPLELLMTKKIGHPALAEFGIGAVSLEDHVLDEKIDVPQSYIDSEIVRIRESLKDRYRKFMGDHKPVDLKDKIVIIVDDGMATGNTILSSLKMLRRRKPKKIVLAIPVAPPDIAEKLKTEVDDFICLYTPEPFIGVGLHYLDFTQVSDDEVIRLLHDANRIVDAA